MLALGFSPIARHIRGSGPTYYVHRKHHLLKTGERVMITFNAVSVARAVKAGGGRPVLLKRRPPRDRRADEAGRCVACGTDTTFAFNSWTIPDDLHAFWADPN